MYGIMYNKYVWHNDQSHPWEKTTWKTVCIQNGREQERDGSIVPHTFKQTARARIHMHADRIRNHFQWEIDSISRCKCTACFGLWVCMWAYIAASRCLWLCVCMHACGSFRYRTRCIQRVCVDFARLYLKRPFLMHLVVCVVINLVQLTNYVYINLAAVYTLSRLCSCTKSIALSLFVTC